MAVVDTSEKVRVSAAAFIIGAEAAEKRETDLALFVVPRLNYGETALTLT